MWFRYAAYTGFVDSWPTSLWITTATRWLSILRQRFQTARISICRVDMQTSSRYRFVYSCEARPLSASETQVTCLHHSGISQHGGESEPTDKRQGTCFRRLRESLALYPLINERIGSVIPMKVIEKCIVDTDFPDVDSLVDKYRRSLSPLFFVSYKQSYSFFNSERKSPTQATR